MDVKTRVKQLRTDVESSIKALKLEDMEKKRDELRDASAAKDFWNEPDEARETMKLLSDLEEEIDTWRSLDRESRDLLELSDMNDESLQADLEEQVKRLEGRFSSLRKKLILNGPHDKDDVLLSIHAGAGGTDAQDWAQILLRMYSRWAEASGYKIAIIDESAGDEAGIKSVSLSIDGRYAYGKLKGEHGVHRLVRLSPFNANNLRQTSFAKVEVLPKIDKPEELELDDKDLKIDVFRAGGHGGQSVNTTDSAVRITHLPTGIVVSIQNERSQLQNRETAMTILRSKLTALQLEQHKETVSELKGPNQSAEWGSQIRNYVLHPYTMVKDLRTQQETSDAASVLDGSIDQFIDAFLEKSINK